MKKFDKIHNSNKKEAKELFNHPNKIGLLQEKIDGANFQFQKVYSDEGQLHQIQFGTRNTLFPINTKKGDYGSFNDAVDFISEKISENNRFMKLNPAYIYFGESTQKHKINYTNIPPFVLFDVFDTEENRYLSWEELKEISETLDLPLIKTYATGPLSMLINSIKKMDLNKLESHYGEGVLAEGVVLKADPGITDKWGNHCRAKFVAERFSERKPGKISLTVEEFVDKYVTEARIDKQINFLKDEKQLEVTAKMTNAVTTLVIKDIIIEEYKHFMKLKTINLKDLNIGVVRIVSKYLLSLNKE